MHPNHLLPQPSHTHQAGYAGHCIFNRPHNMGEPSGLWHTQKDPVKGYSLPGELLAGLPQRDLEAKWAARCQNQQNECAPSKDSDQPGHPPSLIWVFAIRMKKAWVLSYPLNAQQRLCSDWVDAQSDLSLCWAHSRFVGFVMSRLKLMLKYRYLLTNDLWKGTRSDDRKLSHLSWLSPLSLLVNDHISIILLLPVKLDSLYGCI